MTKKRKSTSTKQSRTPSKRGKKGGRTSTGHYDSYNTSKEASGTKGILDHSGYNLSVEGKHKESEFSEEMLRPRGIAMNYTGKSTDAGENKL